MPYPKTSVELLGVTATRDTGTGHYTWTNSSHAWTYSGTSLTATMSGGKPAVGSVTVPSLEEAIAYAVGWDAGWAVGSA